MNNTPNASIERWWTDNNIRINNQIGSMTHVRFTVNGMMNKRGTCTADPHPA